jgi:DNA-binding MarR family transcriptional regulator
VTSAPRLTPQIVGRAENAHLPVLARILARTGITRDQWVALSLTAAAGGTIDRDRLVAQVADALKIDKAAAVAAAADLTGARLLADLPGQTPRVGLTDAGHSRYREIRSAVDEVIARVYRDIPADDLATAGRVLTLITTRLNAETAAASRVRPGG